MPRYNFSLDNNRYEVELSIQWDTCNHSGFEEFLKNEEIEKIPYEHPLHLFKVERFFKIANPDAPHFSAEELKEMNEYKIASLVVRFYSVLDFYPVKLGLADSSYWKPTIDELYDWMTDGTLSKEFFEKDILKNVTNTEYWLKVDDEEDERLFRFKISGYSQSDYAELYVIGEKDEKAAENLKKEFHLLAFTTPYCASVEVYDTKDEVYLASDDITEIYDDTEDLEYVKECILDYVPKGAREGVVEYLKGIRASHNDD